MKFADMHCHPAMRSFNNKTNRLWEPNPGQDLNKLFKAQEKGARGALYDQAGFPKLQTGSVRLVFASLYPLEKGFLKNSNLLLEGLNAAKFFITLPLIWLDGFFSPKFTFRDIFLEIFIKFKSSRLAELKTEGYWVGFQKEIKCYLDEHNRSMPLGTDTTKEISMLMDLASLPTGDLKKDGIFKVADKNYAHGNIQDSNVITVLTMEGMGILSQERKDSPNVNDVELRNLEKQEILNRIQYIKTRIPVFFITFCHHFDNGLCGHARSLPVIAQTLKLVDQGNRLAQGFNQLGFEILKHLLAVKEDVNGRVEDDTSAGRRILIDLKHMSINGRLAVYDLVERYNVDHPAKKIPLIASHVGFSGYSTEQLVDNINQNKENNKNQIESFPACGMHINLNTWSINLGRQEVRRIIDSDGIIGLSMDQNIIGVGFFENIKKKDRDFHAYLIVHQLLIMANASGTSDFWKHISLGSDFDGVINPVDRYTSALFFTKLRSEISVILNKLTQLQLSECFLLPDKSDPTPISQHIQNVIDGFCFANAANFLKKYFDPTDMPVFQ